MVEQLILAAYGTIVTPIRRLGEGSFGQVWKVQIHNGQSDSYGALKVTQYNHPSVAAASAMELSILQACRGYPRIVQLIDWTEPEFPSSATPQLLLMQLADASLNQWMLQEMEQYVDPSSPPELVRWSQNVQADAEPTYFTASAWEQDVTSMPRTHTAPGFISSHRDLVCNIMTQCARAIVQFRRAITAQGYADSGSDGTDPLAPIHLDLKPENFLVRSGHVILADFGVARVYAMQRPPASSSSPSVPLPNIQRNSYEDPSIGLAERLGCSEGQSSSTFDPAHAQCSAIPRFGYKLDEYAVGAMLFALGIDALEHCTATRPLNATLNERASALLRGDYTDAPELLRAVVGLTNPDLRQRWSLDDFLTSPYVVPINQRIALRQSVGWMMDHHIMPTIDAPMMAREAASHSIPCQLLLYSSIRDLSSAPEGDTWLQVAGYTQPADRPKGGSIQRLPTGQQQQVTAPPSRMPGGFAESIALSQAAAAVGDFGRSRALPSRTPGGFAGSIALSQAPQGFGASTASSSAARGGFAQSSVPSDAISGFGISSMPPSVRATLGRTNRPSPQAPQGFGASTASSSAAPGGFAQYRTSGGASDDLNPPDAPSSAQSSTTRTTHYTSSGIPRP